MYILGIFKHSIDILQEKNIIFAGCKVIKFIIYMKKVIVFSMFAGLITSSCNKADWNQEANEKQMAITNFEKKFGVTIDPNQEWNSISSGEVRITANANLEDIVKVQILTESPFLNEEARVLNEATVKNGDVVTLTYSAPDIYKQLVAACVNDKGVYRIQVFNVGDPSVTFASSANAPRRASANEVPDFTSIKLRQPYKSTNTLRTESSDAKFSIWNDSKWNDQMWEIADGQTFSNGWKMDTEKNRGFFYRDINGFGEGEMENVAIIVNSFLYKYDKNGYAGKKNNSAVIRNSTNFVSNNNYVYTDGINPVTLIPIQAYTDDFKMNHIFYYFFKPEDIPAGMTEVDYIKQLPKFKVIQVERIQTTDEKNQGAFYRRQEFLLPFYKGTPVAGDNEASPIFPKGYKIGFLNLKSNLTGIPNINSENHGCTYGDGRLNYEINHFGQFLSAMDKSLGGKVDGGMKYDDPRIAMFSANGKTYMCLEEGSDCNFSDMIIEISNGIQQWEEKPQPEAEAYTMCFEDRPNEADYDMNDLVLRATRVKEDRIQLSIIATGAHDPIVIGGIQGKEEVGFNGKEVHELFGYNNQYIFINTEKNSQRIQPVSEYVDVDKNLRIDDFLKAIYIENRKTGRTINVSKRGEPPFAIIVPISFKYPLENNSITIAYPKFLNWAQSKDEDHDWYLFENADLVYPDYFGN